MSALSLQPALDAVSSAIDHRFDHLLQVPEDARAPLYEAMRYCLIGAGKRMRPLILVSTCELFDVDRERALHVALAVEAIHNYALIHDDLPCMDDDDMRRGKPTVHKHFGQAVAILAGDALQALAFDILASVDADEDAGVRCTLIAELARASGLNGMVGGQVMDMLAATQAFDLTETMHLQQLKTGALIGFCVEAGAIMGRADEESHKRLRAFAKDLGLAFQIVDDILDVTGDSARTGKAVRKDMDAGKSTFVSLMGLDRARAQAQMLVDQAIGHLNIFSAEADLLRAIARFVVERDR